MEQNPEQRRFNWKRAQPGESKKKIPKPKREWIPYPARKHAVAMTLSLPLVCVGALEILWPFSETDVNFITTSSGSSAAIYAVRYSSTALVLGIATLFNSLDFTIATFAPFSALTAKGGSDDRTLFFSMVMDLPPKALYKAIRSKHIGASLSLLASTMGSLLTIIVSSLWFLNTSIQISQAATARIQSGWRIEFGAANTTGNTTASTGAALFNEIQHGGTDGGNLIWDNSVVLPTINKVEPPISATRSGQEAAGGDGRGSQWYNLAVPAVQPILECFTIPSSSIEVYISEIEGGNGLGRPLQISNFVATAQLPDGCKSDSDTNKTGAVSVSYEIDTNRDGSGEDPNWMGFLDDLPVLPDSATGRDASLEGCPSLSAMFGRYLVRNNAGNDGEDIIDYNVVALICTQRIKDVEANVTYNYTPPNTNALTPNLTIPVHLNLNRNTPKNLINPLSNVSSLSYPMAGHFNNNTTPFLSRPRQRFDNFFEHLTTGPEGISHENLLDRDTLTEAATTLYQKFMVHIIDKEFRLPLTEAAADRKLEAPREKTPADDSSIVQGTFTQTVTRLRMNKGSKITLEVLLGSMVLLGVLAYRLVRIRGVLPRNPYTIAGSMALFECSRLLDVFDEQKEGIHINRNKQQDEGRDSPKESHSDLAEVVKGRHFRLGWWHYTEVDEGGRQQSTFMEGSDEEEAAITTQRFGIDLLDGAGQ